jgi:hypothetical protein
MFQTDPDFDLRRNDLTRYVYGAGSPLHRSSRGSPHASLVPTRRPFLIDYNLPLSLYVFVFGKTSLLVCSRSRPGSRIGATFIIRCYQTVLNAGSRIGATL